MTAVHAMHLHTGKLLMFHGVADQRVVSTDPVTLPSSPGFIEPITGEVRWTPLFFHADEPGPDQPNKDLFCAGHAQLADGSVMVAGGNIDGSAGAGGLNSMFRYSPPDYSFDDPPLECPYEWDLEPSTGATPWVNPHGEMLHDRWYPTLTTLRDGRILIAGGYSREFGDENGEAQAESTNLIEIYDPETQQVTNLNGNSGSEADEVRFFSDEDDVAPGTEAPTYPFMFQLPNGDVLYAGGESPANPDETADGRVLVAPENSPSNRWEWASNTLPSEVTGGSAVMFRPGIVLKTGGRAVDQDDDGIDGPDRAGYQTARAEVLDLSGVPGGVDSYAGLQFQAADPMHTPRHYHNTVVLPNGHVVAVGGVSAGNGDAGDRWENPCCVGGPPAPEFDPLPSQYACEQGGTPVVEQECLQGCASSCEIFYGQSPNTVCNFNVDELTTDPQTRCSYIESVPCCDGRGPRQCGEADECAFDGTCDGGPSDGQPCLTHDACGDGNDCVGTCLEQIVGLENNRCDDAMEGAACVEGWCQKTCDPDGDPASECPPIMPVGTDDVCVSVADELPEELGGGGGESSGGGDESGGGGPFKGYCAPANNECFAAYTAEVWDPTCGAWTEAGDQAYPRLYHSTALLLPDGRVMSTGGGHRDPRFEGDGGYKLLNDYPYMEYFEPDYPNGSGQGVPDLVLEDEDGSPFEEDDEAYLPWYSDDSGIETSLPGWINAKTRGDILRFSIIRLGSTTHGFDQDQRFAHLDANLVGDDGEWRSWLILAPNTIQGNAGETFQRPDAVLPPGYYMLFAVTTGGVPSRGQYVRVGSDQTVEGFCSGSPGIISANIVECTGEPIGGACASGDEDITSLGLPSTMDASGSAAEGWRVVLERGADPSTLSILCAQTCEQHFAGIPGASANCDAPGALVASVVDQGTPGAMDMLLPSQRSAPDDAGYDQLDCDLGGDCWTKFDEAIQMAVANRVTPAAAPLGTGEETVLSLDGSSLSVSCGTHDPAAFDLFGHVGLSDAVRDDPSWANPVYMGSFELTSQNPSQGPSAQSVGLTCADGSQETVTVDEIRLSLVQPAFGVEPRGVDEARFAPTAAQLWIEATVDGTKHTVRRPNPAAWTFDRSTQGFDGAPTTLQVTIPCGSSSWADLRLSLDVDSAAVLSSPPTGSIEMPSSVTCGDLVELRETFSDPDGDLEDVRWEVDGVRLASSVSEVAITEGHQLTAVARDVRGATTTAFHNIGCN